MGIIDFLRSAAQGHNARPGWENSNPGNFTSAAYARGPRKPVAGLKAGSGGSVMQQDFGASRYGPQSAQGAPSGALSGAPMGSGALPQAQARVDALRSEPAYGGGSGDAASNAGSFYPPEQITGEESTDLPHGSIGMMDPEMRDDETGQMYHPTGADWEIGPEGATGSLANEIRNPEAERSAMIRRVLESIKGPHFGRR